MDSGNLKLREPRMFHAAPCWATKPAGCAEARTERRVPRIGGARTVHVCIQSSGQAGAGAGAVSTQAAPALTGRARGANPKRAQVSSTAKSVLHRLAKSSGPAATPAALLCAETAEDLALAAVGSSSRSAHPEVSPASALGAAPTRAQQENDRGNSEGGGTHSDLPGGVPAPGRSRTSDHVGGGRGQLLRSARAPGAPLALAQELGKGPGGRHRQPRAEWGSRCALGARSRRLPVLQRAGLSGRGWPWWSRVFCQKPFGSGPLPQPPGAHGSPLRPPRPGQATGGAGS